MTRKLIVIAAWVAVSNSGGAGEIETLLRPESVGMRVGYSAIRMNQEFVKFEMLAEWQLPMGRACDSGWYHQWSLELTAGALTRSDRAGFVTTLGPLLKVGHKDSPLFVTAGIKPTLLGRNRYGNVNFGESFQFTSHLGIGLEIRNHLFFEYHLEHMSNANLAKSNPGLNLHVVAFSFRF